MTDAIDISPAQRKELLELIRRYLPDTEVWAFGSRVKWTARSNSDLDLVAFARQEDEARASCLKEALEESSLPFRVDLLVWDRIPEGFKTNIKEKYVILVDRGNSGRAWSMNPDWKIHTLGELGTIKTGKTPPSALGDGFGGETPFITPGDMNGQKWISDTDRYLSARGLSAVGSYLMPARSVAVSCIGSDMGKAALLSKPSVTNQQINTISVDESKFNAEFVYYDLSIRQKELKSAASGSATPILNKGHFSNFEISIPPRKTQDKIAEILGSVDNKIALNLRINQTLEAMAQALFKSWFVDFDPVKAKIAALAEGRDPLRAAMSAISGKAEAELDALPPEQYAQLAAMAALFPDEMEESELGETPQGWKSSTLGEVCAAHGGMIQTGPFGSQLHAHDYRDEGIPVVMPQDLSGRRIQTTKIARISEDDAQRLQRHRMQPGDVVFSRRGDVGRHALVTQQEAGWLCGTGCLLVRPSTTSTISTYVSCALAQPEALEWLIRHAVGATMPNLNTAILSELPMLSAGAEVIAAFEKRVAALEAAKSSYVAEASALATLRDSLLPKLLSGEFSVTEAIAETEA